MKEQFVIGQFNDSYPPVMDGVANVAQNYAYWLNRKYGKCYVVTPAFPGYQDRDPFPVLRYPSLPLVFRPPYRLGCPHFDLDLHRRLKAIPFDLVHTHSPFSSGQLALKIARQKGIPLVATFHSKFYDDFKTVVKAAPLARLGVRQVIKFFRQVDAVWTVSQGTAETLRAYGYRGKVDVVYNGTDFVPPNDPEQRRAAINERLGLDQDELVFLFVGQHIWQKNVRMLIQGLKLLHQWGVRYRMIFAGTGYAAQEMKELVKELGLAERVTFMGSILDREVLKSLYTRADLFLFPSVYDNAPIVIREAAAAQCPSVVVAGSNSAEGIIDNVNGFLTENDPESLARRVKEIIVDRGLLVAVGEQAQRTVYRHWEQIMAEVVDRYRELIQAYQKKTTTFGPFSMVK
ncbi:MAG TPA: glycosyltransferase family 4 protein [Firmicutes bacterium]|jgi:1,2-diacylglycerol 3-alpha-glucosyltransferase|nr:glycosyltransferase family 4 protein [Bacillota bacterium]